MTANHNPMVDLRTAVAMLERYEIIHLRVTDLRKDLHRSRATRQLTRRLGPRTLVSQVRTLEGDEVDDIILMVDRLGHDRMVGV